MQLDKFLKLCERAAHDAQLTGIVIERMSNVSYRPLDDLAYDCSGHFLWLEALTGYIRNELNNKDFDFVLAPESDIYNFSIGQLHDLISNPYIRHKKAFMSA